MNFKAESTTACVSDRTGEQTLVVAAKNGDEQAFETLFKRYQRRAFAVVLRYTRVVEDAEDIVQQSFYKAFVHLCQFQGESFFSTWLTRIAINEALMFLRSIGAVRTMSIEESSEREERSNALEIPDSSLDPNPSLAEYLNLSQSQIEGIKQVMARERGNVQPLIAQLKAAKEKLQAADARQPNDKNIKVLADTQAGLLAKLIVANARVQSKIYKLLTPEQHGKLDYLKRRNESAAIVASAK